MEIVRGQAYEEFENEPCQRLYRIKEDGAGKELVYEWDGWTIEEWCIHRGEFFYVNHVYYENETEKGAVEELCVKKIPIEGFGTTVPELVYEGPEDIEIAMIMNLNAYGNFSAQKPCLRGFGCRLAAKADKRTIATG